MSKTNKITKQHFIQTILFAAWLTLCNIIFTEMHIHHTWPAFFICIFYFAFGLNPARVKEIYAGSISGLVFGFLLIPYLGAVSPVLGGAMALHSFIFLVLFIILMLGPVAHTYVNPISFTYALMCLIHVNEIQESIFEWGVMTVIGGSLIIGGIYGITKILNRNTDIDTSSESHG